VDRRARIRVGSQHVTLGTFDAKYIPVAVEAARLKKEELSGGVRGMALTEDVSRQLREAAERAVSDASRLITVIESQDSLHDPAVACELRAFGDSLPVELGSAHALIDNDLQLSVPPSAPDSNASNASNFDGAPATAAASRRLTVTQIEVAGMCCQSEVSLVHKKLDKMAGVADVKVNLMLRRVAVTHDAEQVSAAHMLRALNWSLLGASLVDHTGSSSSLRRGTLCTKEAALLAVTFVLFGMAGGIWARPEGTEWYEDPFSYAALVCVALGLPVLLARALAGCYYQRTINMFCTMVIAVTGALALLDLWEASAIVFFFVASEWLQQWCVHHTAKKSRGLGGMMPDTVSPADGSADKPLSEVLVGEALLVKPGLAVPTDGVVLDGSSAVDESMLTGESMPVEKTEGATVYAGTTNQRGVLTIRVLRLASESSAAQLTRMVATAQRTGSRELLLERFAKLYTLAILLTAMLLATVPLGTCTWQSAEADGSANTTASEAASEGGPGMCTWWLRRALALVVISCPCSLIVAMPVTYACGVSSLARWGILVKSQAQMELLAQLHTLALDKTGTLTEGRFRLRQLAPAKAVTAKGDDGLQHLLSLVAAAEKNSSHPIAEAFLEYASMLGVDPPPARDFELLAGEGIRATVDGETVHIGSEKMARRLLAQADKARNNDDEVCRARQTLKAASKAAADAVRDGLPERLIRSLRKKEEAALRRLEEADLAARDGTKLALATDASTAATEGCPTSPLPPPHLVTCRNHNTCGGCAPKMCCRHGGRRPCRGSCCHRHCCGKPCEHTGPCPRTDEADTGKSHDQGNCGHNHSPNSHDQGNCGHHHSPNSHDQGNCGHNHSHAHQGCAHQDGAHRDCAHEHAHAGDGACGHGYTGGACNHDHAHDDHAHDDHAHDDHAHDDHAHHDHAHDDHAHHDHAHDDHAHDDHAHDDHAHHDHAHDDHAHDDHAHDDHAHCEDTQCAHEHHEPSAEHHGHNHGGGVSCTHDHTHSECTRDDHHHHEHSHDGVPCTHGLDHACPNPRASQQHEHSHDGVPCTHDHAYDGYSLSLSSPLVHEWSAAGASVLWVVVDGQLAAAVHVAEVHAVCQLSDQIRAETAPAMRALASLGVTTTMLTGDAEGTAQAVRAQAGIASAISCMTPDEKLERVRALAREGVVGMIGDGVNDGPALAAADVGIAMGVGGTALASQAAGIVLMTNDLRRVADAIVGARHTTRMLRVSVAIALLLKLLPLVLIFTLSHSAEGLLVATAVSSDLIGIVLVLLGAMSLLGARPKFATTPCSNSQNSMEGPAVVTTTAQP